MNRNFVQCGLALLATVLVATAVPTPAQAQWSAEPSPPEPAAVSVSAGAIDLFPSVSYSRAILTVSNGDTVTTRVFAGRERPSIDRMDPAGNLLADGVYNWELELIPDARSARELRRSANGTRDEAPGAWQPQSGSFTIQGGAFVSPNLAELDDLARVESDDFTAQAPFSSRSASDKGYMDYDGSGMSDEVAQAAAAGPYTTDQPYGAGLQAAVASYADGDGNAAATGSSVETLHSTNFIQAAAVPHRSIEPGGKNGRPEKED